MKANKSKTGLFILIFVVSALQVAVAGAEGSIGGLFTKANTVSDSLVATVIDAPHVSSKDLANVPTKDFRIISEEISTVSKDDADILRAKYSSYTKKARRAKIVGYAGAAVSVLAFTVAAITYSPNDNGQRTDAAGNAYVSGDVNFASGVVAGLGLTVGVPLTLTGFILSNKYKKKAATVSDELKRRGLPLSLRVTPSYNAGLNAGMISVKINF